MLAFVHVSKTAGTTITGILRRNFSRHHLDTRVIQDKPAITAAQLKRAQWIYPRIRSIAGHAVRTTSDLRRGFPGIRFHTFLRDPARRIVSAYLFDRGIDIAKRTWQPGDDVAVEMDFERYLRGFGDSYCRIFTGGQRADPAIEAVEREVAFIGLVEEFEESLALFRNWVGLPGFDVTYRRLNVGSSVAGKGKATEITAAIDRLVGTVKSVKGRPRFAALIEEVTAADRQVYGHVVRAIWPRLRERHSAGPGPFNFERDEARADTLAGRACRNLLGRPFVRLLTGPGSR
jgi:hypothetical protein